MDTVDRQPDMIDIPECQRRIGRFLTGDLADAFRATSYRLPDWDEPDPAPLAQVAEARVQVRHRPGASDALYRIAAFGEVLELRVQLNVWRFVLVYGLPAGDLVDVAGVAPRFARWQEGAAHAGWTLGWRDAVDPWDHGRRLVETYAYAMLPRTFLMDPMAQLFWRTDIAQMTRSFMLEARRGGVPLAPPGWTADATSSRG